MELKTPVIFNSRDEQFKSPVGPMKAGGELHLNLLVSPEYEDYIIDAVVQFDKDHGYQSYEMLRSDDEILTETYLVYTTDIPLIDRGLYWYSFSLMNPYTGERLFIGKSADENRAVLSPAEPIPWQQTVYHREYKELEWLQGGIFYHIFVDRFRKRGEPVYMDGKITREDWGGMPEYRPDQNGIIQNNDFFGGNLEGIREKLPYLQDLGVTCLYLSPIFEAYSSHKYDTGNYMRIDPMFGDEKDFTRLCEDAMAFGIRIILDGVFSHTGSDSIYFNKYGHYDSYGAWGHPDSPYRDWYYFEDGDHYQSWWGIDTLPRINKMNPDYAEFINGEDGVIRHWLRAGASGWRLDVADEFPNCFLESLTKAAKAEKSDALVLGEVWEDASNKIAYDERKNYFEGDKLDSVMNYPFREGIISFVRRGNPKPLKETVETIMENYPPEVVHVMMNHLGSHDTSRILTALAGEELSENATRDLKATLHLSEEQRQIGLRLLRIAVVLQMTLPGVPCVYYGDEVETEGYNDPFNRTCYPWGYENEELQDWYRKIIHIRRDHHVYRTGSYRTLGSIGGLFAFERADQQERIITAANCGNKEETLYFSGLWKDLLTGRYESDNITVFPGEVLLLKYKEER